MKFVLDNLVLDGDTLLRFLAFADQDDADPLIRYLGGVLSDHPDLRAEGPWKNL